MSEIAVATDQGPIQVEARAIRGGLAITMHPGDALDPGTLPSWRPRGTVTHIESGRSVLKAWGSITNTRRALKALLPLCDWGQTHGAIERLAKGNHSFMVGIRDARELILGQAT